MSDELQLTRRGLFQFITAFIATASFAARRPLFAPTDDVLEAEIVVDESPRPHVNRRYRTTKLETYLRSRGIKPAHLARESGYSRQHLLRIRMGRMEPTRRCMVEITAACCRLSRETVRVSDLFNLQPNLRLLRSAHERASTRPLAEGDPR